MAIYRRVDSSSSAALSSLQSNSHCSSSAADPARAARLGRVALLAPILAFPREADLGGRIGLAEIRLLGRVLRQDREAALAGFYERAGFGGRAGRSRPAVRSADTKGLFPNVCVRL